MVQPAKAALSLKTTHFVQNSPTASDLPKGKTRAEESATLAGIRTGFLYEIQ
jgi:hypothetical protein